MVAKRKAKDKKAQLAFEALSIEGGLLSPEWLSKVAQLQAGTQGEADYRIPRGLNLRDEIGRYWRIAQAHWADFKLSREAKADGVGTAQRFVLTLLRDTFGFISLAPAEPVVLQERIYPIGYASLAGRVPVVVASADSGLDTLTAAFGDGGRRRSAFGLVQEYLNAQEGALWGVACDGSTLRIVRDNASLTRPAWIDADLQRIFSEDLYADFAALWLLCHETRFGREGHPASDCALEAWRNAGRQEGTRAREHLRRGVEDSLTVLGQGFLAHAENQILRADLQSGTLPIKSYFNQLLRLIYRLIFLLTVEERGLLHPDGTSEDSKTLYAGGYSIRRLRERSVKRSAHDRFSDLWDATKIVNRGLANGEERLGLPALVGIFSEDQCPSLDTAKLENRTLLLAVFKLAWLRESGGLSRVNWRDMGPEELGSIYESLLELVPQITKDGRTFAFATGGQTKGNARKTTGSYYTPDSLVQALIDSALEPVIADTIAKNPGQELDALLGLSVVDPACGSGHFLLAAARRLASHVARVQVNGTPSASEYRHALRRVVGRCIYGVDLNLMAVELCKVSLWMEAVEPGLPLTFLNSHIQHGNSLLGTTPELMSKGIPDDAWDTIEGDDKRIASALKKRNKAETGGQRTLDFSRPPFDEAEALEVARAVATLEEQSDASPEALAKKTLQWDGILGSPEYRHQRFTADGWCAAFVWPKQTSDLADAAPTNYVWQQIREGNAQPTKVTTRVVNELAEQYRFFHWHLQFPQVFSKGGFNAVLGNPPWDKIQPEEVKFFAGTRPEIAQAENAKTRKTLIADLEKTDSMSYKHWMDYKRQIDGTCAFLRRSGVLKFTGDGNLNSYRIFTELGSQLIARRGRLGLVTQTGLATDESGKEFFEFLLSSGRLVQFLDFENRKPFFPEVDERFRFALITVRGPVGAVPGHSARFGWLLHDLDELLETGRLIDMSAQDVLLFNPTSHTSPILNSMRALRVSRAIYGAAQYVYLSAANRFGSIEFLGELFNMTRDSQYFMKAPDSKAVSLYEAKFIHQFDHRFASTVGDAVVELGVADKSDPTSVSRTKSYVSEEIVLERMSRRGIHTKWLSGFRDIASPTNERTAIFAVFPFSAVGNNINLVLGLSAKEVALLSANVNTFVFDYCARQKISGTHVNIWIFKQLPLVPISRLQGPASWSGSTLQRWLLSRVLELTYTAWDLEPFALELDYVGPPFRWHQERRFLLRCELDSCFFLLYRLSREDAEYVMDAFPLVRKNDEREHGEYRTKRVVLEIYDRMIEAERTGETYRTLLNPVPADPAVAHSGRVMMLPQLPAVIPQLPPSEEMAFIILALLRAAGGTLTRTDLGRAYALRNNPSVVRQFAPSSLSQVGEWADRVAARPAMQGLFAATFKALADRNGITLGVNSESRSTVSTSASTPDDTLIDPWFRFEARLLLATVRALPSNAFATVDGSLTGDDRKLIDEERMVS